MVRNPFMKVATATLVLGVLTLVGSGVAWAAPVASGTATCPVQSGSGTLSPGLTAAGQPGGVKITFKAKLGPSSTAGCSGSATLPSGLPVVINKGTLTGSGFFNGPGSASGNSCVNFDGPDILGTIKATVHWVASHPIAPSHVSYTGGTPAVSGSPTDTISLPATGTTTAKTGSLALPPLPDSITLVTNIPSTCLASSPPFTHFTITGGVVSL
jgi:hypothetical protein